MAKIKKVYSLDPEVVEMIDGYAKALHVSQSAFVTLMVSQIDRVLRVTGLELPKKDDAGSSGDD